MEAKLLDEAPDAPDVPLCGLTGWITKWLDYCMMLSENLRKYLDGQGHRIDPTDSAKSVIKLLHLRTLTMKIQTTCNKLETEKGLIIGLPMSPDRLGSITAAIEHITTIMDQYGAFTACYKRSQVGNANIWAQSVKDFMDDLGASEERVDDWKPALFVFNDIHAVLVAMRELEQSRLDLEESTCENALAAYADAAEVIRPLDEP